jgi:hypothetical protein
MSTAEMRRAAIGGRGVSASRSLWCLRARAGPCAYSPWTPELVEMAAAARRAAVPLEQWEECAAWRAAR